MYDEDTEDEEERVSLWNDSDWVILMVLEAGTKTLDNKDIPLPARRAIQMFLRLRTVICAECKSSESDTTICRCDPFDLYVGERWLCLHCFFQEEAKSYETKNFIIVSEDLHRDCQAEGQRSQCGLPVVCHKELNRSFVSH